VRDSGFLQDFGDGFGFFNGDGTDENRLATFVKCRIPLARELSSCKIPLTHGFKLLFFGAIDNVGIFPANQRCGWWNHDDVKVVNLAESRGFGFRSAVMPESFLYMRK